LYVLLVFISILIIYFLFNKKAQIIIIWAYV
jgi:hypothetical protein